MTGADMLATGDDLVDLYQAEPGGRRDLLAAAYVFRAIAWRHVADESPTGSFERAEAMVQAERDQKRADHLVGGLR